MTAKKKRRPRRAETVVTLIAVGVAVALLALVPFIGDGINAGRDLHEYSGVVVRKTSLISQTKYGSKLQLQLVVRTDGGDEFTAPVPPAVYAEARVGSRITKKAGESIATIERER